MIKHKYDKDGPNWLLRTWEVGETKPKCWVEGSNYYFNQRLLSVEKVAAPEANNAPNNSWNTNVIKGYHMEPEYQNCV